MSGPLRGLAAISGGLGTVAARKMNLSQCYDILLSPLHTPNSVPPWILSKDDVVFIFSKPVTNGFFKLSTYRKLFH